MHEFYRHLGVPVIFKVNMSQSPDNSFFNGSETTGKKRKINTPVSIDMSTQSESPGQHSAHVPKRGARACTNCRRGKNRCEGEVWISHHNGCPRSVLLTMARLPRPRPGPSFTASLQEVSTEWHALYLRETREEKCTRFIQW